MQSTSRTDRTCHCPKSDVTMHCTEVIVLQLFIVGLHMHSKLSVSQIFCLSSGCLSSVRAGLPSLILSSFGRPATSTFFLLLHQRKKKVETTGTDAHFDQVVYTVMDDRILPLDLKRRAPYALAFRTQLSSQADQSRESAFSIPVIA